MRDSLETVFWITLRCVLLTPVIGVPAAVALADIPGFYEPSSVPAEFSLVDLLAGLGALVSSSYFLALFVLGLPALACGIVLGTVLVVLARWDRASFPLRAVSGAVVGGVGWVAFRDLYAEVVGYQSLMWTFILTYGLCGALVGRRWLAMNLALEGQPLFPDSEYNLTP